MRKMFIAVLLMCLVMRLHAQVPEQKSVALIHKLTATWCPPCGGWGWQTAEELITGSEGKALFMSLYVGYNDNDNYLFKNPASEALAPNFTTTSGLPNFGVNGMEHTSAYISDKNTDIAGLKAACLNTVSAFSAAPPPASPACIMRIDGNTLTVDTKIQFWSAAQGDYYLAAYIIEDSAVNQQRTPDSIRTAALHRKVLRGSVSGKPYGELVASGAIPAGQVYDRQFRFTLTDPGWNKRKLEVYAVLWRKVYNDYKYVNASSSQTVHQPTLIPAVPDIEEPDIFPNPAYGAATLSFTARSPQTVGISITDMTGRIVYRQQNSTRSDSNTIALPLQDVPAGVYMVMIQTPKGKSVKRLTLLR